MGGRRARATERAARQPTGRNVTHALARVRTIVQKTWRVHVRAAQPGEGELVAGGELCALHHTRRARAAPWRVRGRLVANITGAEMEATHCVS